MASRSPVGTEPKPALTLDSRLTLNDLTVVADRKGKPPLLGCQQSRRFLEVSVETLHAVEAIARTSTLREANDLLYRSHGFTADMVEFAATLYERGFVKTLDGQPVGVAQSGAERHPYLHAIPPTALRWLHHPALWGLAAFLVVEWIALIATHPGLRPSVSSLSLFQRPSLTLASTLGGALLLSYIHELAHFFVARSYGIEATIDISHRFLVPVLQTDVTNAWALPPAARLRIFLAGMTFNLLAAALATYAIAATAAGLLDLAPRTVDVLAFVGYLNIFPLFFQFFITARTDLYHVALVLTRQRNLRNDSRAYLLHRLRRVPLRAFGRLDRNCLSCHAPLHARDPFCPGCGKTLAPDSPLASVTRRNRFLFLGFGLLLVAGALLAYWMVYTLVVHFVLVLLLSGVEAARLGWARQDTALLVDGVVAVAFGAAKLAFAGFFFWQSVRPYAQAAGRRIVQAVRPAARSALDAPVAAPLAPDQTK